MKKGLQKVVVLMLVLALTFTVQVNLKASAADSVTITVLETSDIHGRLMAYDYSADAVASTGLTKVASVIREEREKDPDLIYVDNGDTTQGNLISDFRFNKVHPAILALNELECDLWELGNHEFNYEFESLCAAIDAFEGTTLGANIYEKDGSRWLDAYKIFEVKGVKVAIFGMEAPHINVWEAANPEHYNNMTFTSIMDETAKVLDEIEAEGADIVIGLCHYGEEGEYDAAEYGGMDDVAKKFADRVDCFLVGHSHNTVCKSLVDGEWVDGSVDGASTYMLEPSSNGALVSKAVFTVEKDGDSWKLASTAIENINVSTYEEDAALVKALEEHHKASVELSNSVIGSVGEDFFENGENEWLPGIGYAFIQDSAIIDLINTVQLKNAGADVSMAALLDASANLTAGDYKMKDGVKVYKYDNTLYGVKCTGKQLKAIMEYQAGRYFNTYKEGDVTISFNPAMRSYLFDAFAGVDYEIDISKPEGQRIVNVKYKGKKLKDSQQLILAVNNYRFGQLCTLGYLNAEDAVYSSLNDGGTAAVRDMISEYVMEQEGGVLLPECDNNWRIIGADLDDPQAEEIYEMIRNGEITIPTSEDGRSYNIAAINADELRAQGVIATPEEEEESEEETAEPKTYTVVSGDYLRKIAKKLFGDESVWKKIYNANKSIIKNPDLIYVGQILNLPE